MRDRPAAPSVVVTRASALSVGRYRYPAGTICQPDTPALLALDLARRLDRHGHRSRYLLGLVGPPGSGKSTLAEQLRAAARITRPALAVEVVPMDGFHLPDAELDRRGLRSQKGSSLTFDVAAFRALLGRLAALPRVPVLAPAYSRKLHEPVPDAIAVPVETDVVIVEGNYLLLADDRWKGIGNALDEVWFLDVELAEVERRLTQRHRRGGKSAEESRRIVEASDLVNARRIAATRHRADRIVRLAPGECRA